MTRAAQEGEGTVAESERTRRIKALLKVLNESGIRDRDVLLAIAKVPRERFVAPELRRYAWENQALPIGEQQTISQPLVTALMTQALRLTGAERVLEIGTGSGYQTAILCELAKSVISLERHSSLARDAKRRLEALDYRNAQLIVADGSQGWPSGAPYDRILVAAAAPSIPTPLVEQLARRDGARLVIPVGGADQQDLIAVERRGGRLIQTTLGSVRFVPLIGGEAEDEPATP